MFGCGGPAPSPEGEASTLSLVQVLHSPDRSVRMALDGASLVRNGIRVPRSAPRAARISAAEGAWLEVSDPSLSPFTPPQVVSDTVIFREAARSTDVVFVAGPNHLEELRVLRDGRASPVARYRLEHGPAIAVVRLREGRVEAVDAHGVVRVASAPAFAIDATGRRRDVVLRLADDTLEARVDLEGLTFPVVVDPTWSTVAPMATAGHGASAVLLTDGRVLVTGGDPITKSGEVYDPKLNTWTTAKPLELHRFPLAVRLGSGKVLVAGGMSYTTELFDPASGAYSKTGNLTATHQNGAIALLPSGKVLVAAGFSDGGQVGETYDPTTGVWTPTPPLVAYRDGPGAALLSSGRVLLAGGHDPGGTLQSSAEIYNPTTNTWTAAASMSAGRRHMAIAVLPTGKVLVAGGGEPAGLLSSAEIYDPATNTWTSAPSMAVPRTFARATVLTSGRILVAGGIKAFSEVYSSAEVFDGTSFSSAGAMAYGRFEHTQTLLADGKVLIAGGHTLSVDLSTAEVFAYSAPGEACVSALGCVSGQCVDGVCCNTGCAAACDACDVGGALGTCSKVASGAPHGGRELRRLRQVPRGRLRDQLRRRWRLRRRVLLRGDGVRRQEGRGGDLWGRERVRLRTLRGRRVLRHGVHGPVSGVRRPRQDRRVLPRRRRTQGHASELRRDRRGHRVWRAVRRDRRRGLPPARHHDGLRRGHVRGRRGGPRRHLRRRRQVSRHRRFVRRICLRRDGLQEDVREQGRLRTGLSLQRHHLRPDPRARRAVHRRSRLHERLLHGRRLLRGRELRCRELVRGGRQGPLRQGARNGVCRGRGVWLSRVRRRRVLRPRLRRAM